MVTKRLNKLGIETRPLISGNFARQPAVKLYNLDSGKDLKNANYVDKNSFFIGLHNKKINNKLLKLVQSSFYKSL